MRISENHWSRIVVRLWNNFDGGLKLGQSYAPSPPSPDRATPESVWTSIPQIYCASILFSPSISNPFKVLSGGMLSTNVRVLPRLILVLLFLSLDLLCYWWMFGCYSYCLLLFSSFPSCSLVLLSMDVRLLTVVSCRTKFMAAADEPRNHGFGVGWIAPMHLPCSNCTQLDIQENVWLMEMLYRSLPVKCRGSFACNGTCLYDCSWAQIKRMFAQLAVHQRLRTGSYVSAYHRP